MSMNGRKEKIMDAKREHEEEKLKLQQESKQQQQALQQAFNQDGQLSRGFVESIVSKEDLEIGAPDEAQAQGDVVQEATVAKLQNMLSRDWVLGNLTEAQEHDARHKAEVIKLKIIDMHPPEASNMQGRVRQFFRDGGADARLTSLSSQDKLLIDELIETLKVRFGRGREGFEREQQNTSISRAETESDESEESSSGWTGVFG